MFLVPLQQETEQWQPGVSPCCRPLGRPRGGRSRSGPANSLNIQSINQPPQQSTYTPVSSIADPWHFGTDPDIHTSDCWIQDVNKKYFFFQVFLLIIFWRYIYIIFRRQKVIKKSQHRRNQCFCYYICLMIEGFGSGSKSGSISLTNGSGSGRPKNIWTPRIQIQIQIRNTACKFWRS